MGFLSKPILWPSTVLYVLDLLKQTTSLSYEIGVMFFVSWEWMVFFPYIKIRCGVHCLSSTACVCILILLEYG